jgi:hypothetical protein
VIEKHEGRRPLAHDLAAKLAADRTSSAGHEDHLAGNVARKQGWIRRHRVAAEQVSNINLANVGNTRLAVDEIE